jgi:hypothetical protein
MTAPMRWILALSAVAMPVVAFFSQRGAFGPTNGEISAQYPTLLVAAGYAFSIWGLIFLLDLLYAFGDAVRRGTNHDALDRARPAAAAGFFLTAAWMPVFSLELFGLALAIIWAALAAMVWAAIELSRAPAPRPRLLTLGWVAVSLHAGWLSLAAFLNLAQVLVAWEVPGIFGLSVALFAAAALVLLGVQRRMGGNLPYAAAALWGLAAVYVKQSSHGLDGSDAAAWIAVAIAIALAVQTGWLVLRRGVGPSGQQVSSAATSSSLTSYQSR